MSPDYSTFPLKTLRLSHHNPTSSSPSQSASAILIITLNRPQARNAFTDTMAAELEHVFRLVAQDDRIKCVVVTGTGDSFCAGADLKESEGLGKINGGGRDGEHRDGGGIAALAIHQCPKPVIAAINGPAIGVGITMTLPMALRFVTSTAKIGFVFARRGIAMEACSSFFLPRLIGYSRAMQLVTTGRVLKAEDKVLNGLWAGVAKNKEECLNMALAAAEEFVQNVSGVGWAMCRDMMWRDAGSAEGQHLLDSAVLAGLRRGRDCAEGVQSFLEKRPANFVGTLKEDAPLVYPWWTPVETRTRRQKEEGLLDSGSKSKL